MIGSAALTVGVAAALDSLIAEPPERAHPIALLGALISRIDRMCPDTRTAGVVVAGVVPVGFAVAAASPVVLTGVVAPRLAAVVAGVVLYACLSRRLLVATADRVVSFTEADLLAARDALRALAGRDADELSAAQVRSAAVESAAENLADGLIAPLAAFTIGGVSVSGFVGVVSPVSVSGFVGMVSPVSVSGMTAGDTVDPAIGSVLVLAFATGIAAWVKGVNTLDSMLGYQTRRIGWAPARLDDLVMWIPARLSAAAIAVAAGRPVAVVTARRWARIPASPNSGWPMATIASVLAVRLEKPGAYTLRPAAACPSVTAAQRGIRIVNRAAWIAIATAVICCLAVDLLAVRLGLVIVR